MKPPAPHAASLVMLRIDQIRPHAGFVRHNPAPSAQQLSTLLERGDLSFQEPFYITQDCILLNGYTRWYLACKQGAAEVQCLQVNMTEEEALLWIIQKHRRSDWLNDYIRILLALELEPWFRERARANQSMGGHLKASSNLTEADKLDVRTNIAKAAGVSAGNVTKCKRLLELGHPDLLEALREGEVSINLASNWLKNPKKQLDELKMYRLYLGKEGITTEVDRLLRRHNRPNPAAGIEFDIQSIGTALTAMNSPQKDSVLIGMVQAPGEVLLLSKGLLRALEHQRELHL